MKALRSTSTGRFLSSIPEKHVTGNCKMLAGQQMGFAEHGSSSAYVEKNAWPLEVKLGDLGGRQSIGYCMVRPHPEHGVQSGQSTE